MPRNIIIFNLLSGISSKANICLRNYTLEIKKAYRRLMSRSHPDKIAGSNPGKNVVAEAERRTREVRSVYEMLKAIRSIR